MQPMIVYFSRTGENYVGGTIKYLEVGNTEIAAKMIAELTGANLFEMKPMVAYSDDYNQCIDEAKRDLDRDARPELVAWPTDMEAVDTIYLGYPNYWGTMPMVVFTFLERYDLTGKRIKPFCTHEGSGMGRSEADIRRLCPDSKVEKGLAIVGAKVQSAKDAITKWI